MSSASGSPSGGAADAWDIPVAFISVIILPIVGNVAGAADAWDIPAAFISVVILPIMGMEQRTRAADVGNAAEHASAIMFAAKDIVVRASGGVIWCGGVQVVSRGYGEVQVIPFCVVVGWVMGVPLDLNFHLFETATLCMTELVIAALLHVGNRCLRLPPPNFFHLPGMQEGKSN
ncbi:unnamed protein product [Closterium sp. NIES-64]|nr:unnamed protein product [Closterium sp. NIES-64]